MKHGVYLIKAFVDWELPSLNRLCYYPVVNKAGWEEPVGMQA